LGLLLHDDCFKQFEEKVLAIRSWLE